MSAKIVAIEYHYPKNQLSNERLAIEFPDYDFEKFEEKIGIKNRYIVDEDDTALDLAVEATEKIFRYFDKNLIDFVLYCTQSPEYILPTTACILQDRIGLRKNIGAMDFNLGCSGYTYGLSIAKGLINSGQANHVLLVTAETYSKFLHPQDRSNRAIFGDAATATIIAKSDDEMMGNFLFGTDGSGFENLIIRNGGSKHSFNEGAELINYGTDNFYTSNHLYMNGPEIFNFTGEKIPPFTEELLKANELEKAEVSQFIFHQANAFMLNFMRKRLKVTPDRFFVDLADGGNTVSNSIPIALKKYSETKIAGNIENIVLVGFGVGLSWSGGLIRLKDKL